MSLSDAACAALDARGPLTLTETIVEAVRANFEAIEAAPDRPVEAEVVTDELGLPVPAPRTPDRQKAPPRVVSVAFTRTEHTALHRLAKRAGLSVSALVDQALSQSTSG